MKPRKLKLLPGKRWQGTMTVREQSADGHLWLVDFDAIDPKATTERWIGDRATLTAQQIEEWTGVRLPTPAKGEGG
jgi:hypothetical protein